MLSGSSPDLSYRTLDYDVAVQADGSLKVTQHIDMKLRTRDGDTPWRQLYQKYTLREDGLTNITDISVRNVTAGENYEQGVHIAGRPFRYVMGPRIRRALVHRGRDRRGREPPAVRSRQGRVRDQRQHDLAAVERRGDRLEHPATKKASSLKFDVTMTLHGGTTLYKDVASCSGSRSVTAT